MNAIVFGGEKGGEIRSLLLARKVSLSGDFINLFPHYICDGLLFLFSVCWFHVNEFNIFWGVKGERSEVYCLLERYSVQNIKEIAFIFIVYNDSWRYHCIIIDNIRISHNLLSPSPSLSQRLLYSFLLEPKHRKKKYYHIPDAASERV